MIRDFHHTVLLVTNIQRSLDFYCGTLGFELISADDDRRGPFLDQMFALDDVLIKLALVRGGGEIIELIEPVSPPELLHTDASSHRFGIARIGFEVDDIDNMVLDLTAQGVEFLSPVVDMTVGHYAGGKVVFFRDPDGILLELQQPAVPGQIT
ncbi:VOC family protein [Wenjunlia tyrosinilytica]|uniref:Glyoxalase n=1 Tax=Wenjunlia tyrosinilytica TaxID=1544741 RepID=A0A917ZYD5_9ACTN|nr:VOC family protein [Wenjunlia tyrosinilytica]GGO97182.1 glyoxalase [Wenjunlia tyrosinilytica]